MKNFVLVFASVFVASFVGCEGSSEGEGEGEEGEGEEGEGEEGEGEGEGEGEAVPAEITTLCATHAGCVAGGGSTARLGNSVEECVGGLVATIDVCPAASAQQLLVFTCLNAVIGGDCTVLDAAAPPTSCDDEQATADAAADAACP